MVVETKEEKRRVKPKEIRPRSTTATQVERRLWEEDEAEEQAKDQMRRDAENDAFNSWKSNRRLWRGSEVDKEMALMRERVRMRQLQEKMRLVTQPVIQSESEVPKSPEHTTWPSEDMSGDDSISPTPSQSVKPYEIENYSPSVTSKPNKSSASTPPTTASKTACSRKRMERGMASLEAILKDIMEAVKVMALITPVDATEAAAVGKRESEFAARFRRLSYQLRRAIATFKSLRLKLRLKGQDDDEGVCQNMLQVLSSSRLLLTTYLRYIPLSGGRVFPAVVGESMPILNQALVEAKALEVDCSAVEVLLSQLKIMLLQENEEETPVKDNRQNESVDDVDKSPKKSSRLFEELARNTFGPPLGASQQLSKDKTTPKPRGTKLLQARTNMARSRRMSADFLGKSDRKSIGTRRSPSSSRSNSSTQPLSIPVPQSSRSSPQESRVQNNFEIESFNGSVETGSVLSRLHNLEILASKQSSESFSHDTRLPVNWENNRPERVVNEEKENFRDLGMMVARIEIIKSDFDVVAQVRLISLHSPELKA